LKLNPKWPTIIFLVTIVSRRRLDATKYTCVGHFILNAGDLLGSQFIPDSKDLLNSPGAYMIGWQIKDEMNHRINNDEPDKCCHLLY
jgi:hypothetical protein